MLAVELTSLGSPISASWTEDNNHCTEMKYFFLKKYFI